MYALLLATAIAAALPSVQTETPHGAVAWLDARDRGAPDQPVAVFLHGLPTSKELWLDVLDAMPDQPAIAVDLLDFGESSAHAPEALDHRQRAAAVEALCATLDLSPIILIAHDLGASVAVDYMAGYAERVSHLVLMSSPVYPDFDEPAVVDLVRRPWLGRPLLWLAGPSMYRATLQRGLHNDARYTPREDALFKRDYAGRTGRRRMWQNLWWGTPEVDFAHYPETLRAISVPTLILHGAQDPFIPTAHAHRLDADVPQSDLILFEGAAHFLPLDIPERVAEAITGFLAAPSD